jgi:hypothetical protein
MTDTETEAETTVPEDPPGTDAVTAIAYVVPTVSEYEARLKRRGSRLRNDRPTTALSSEVTVQE